MNIKNKTSLLLESLNVEEMDLLAAEQIINISADLVNHTGRALLTVFNESVGVQKTFSEITQALTAPEYSDSRKLKTISRLIESMPPDIYRSITESQQDKSVRIFKS